MIGHSTGGKPREQATSNVGRTDLESSIPYIYIRKRADAHTSMQAYVYYYYLGIISQEAALQVLYRYGTQTLVKDRA